ncbi:MAG: gliding motility-associated C-terminal domain-containing protein, partial [Flavobacteriales bacterium]
INTSDILNLSDGIDTTEFVNPFETELLFTDTVYSFLLSDSIGCFSEPIAWNIEVIQTPGTLEISGDSLLCEGDELVLTASPADNGLITFLDLSSDTLGIANSGGQLTLSAVGIGDIYQSVLAQLYMDGCTIQSTALEVEVLPIPAQPELIQIGNGCPNDTVLIYAADSAGLAHYWAGPNNFSSNNQVISFEPIEHDQQGTYTLFVQQSICQSETASINIQIAPEPEVSLPADTVICLGDIIDLNTNEFFDEVVWSTGEVSEVISVEDSGYYWVLVHNEFDCQDSDSILVETTVCDVAVGNAFTPNNDGINDLFKLNSEGLQEIEVKIFNRFGRLIYRWETLDGAWDGTIQNNSFDAQEGTYFFVGNYLDISGEAGTKKGYIQLTR